MPSFLYFLIKRFYIYNKLFRHSLVLESSAREHAISRLVSSHVTKAEKARRHGRELSFILPHDAVNNFAPLFSAIENEIKTRTLRLGISSYGVSMTTLEEVLHVFKFFCFNYLKNLLTVLFKF